MQTTLNRPKTLILPFLSLLLLSLVLYGCRSAPTPTPARPSPTAQVIGMATITPLPFGQPTPTATFPPCGTPPAGWKTYLVQPGDTLVQIAEQAGIGVAELVRANCLTSTDLAIGQRLYIPAPKPCDPPPAAWFAYVIQPGDTLFDLATRAGVSVAEVQEVNCMRTIDLISGERIYLPPLPEPTPTPCVAIPPDDWTQYMVEAGDTLFDLAVARDTTVDEIMRVNCLTSSVIVVGQSLFLPPAPLALESPAPLALESPASLALESPASLALESPAPRPLESPAPRALVSPAPRPLLPPVLRALLPPALRPVVPPAEAAPISPGGSSGGPVSPGVQPTKPPPCQGLNCVLDSTLPPLELAPGGPNEVAEIDFVPCDGASGPRVVAYKRTVEVGELRYFFACEFSGATSAVVTMSDGITKTANLLPTIPNCDLQQGSASAVAYWAAEPIYPLGVYTVTFTNGSGGAVSLTFRVELPDPEDIQERILIVPAVATPGPDFEVYYVYFNSDTRPTSVLQVEDNPVCGKTHHYTARRAWQVPIDHPLAGLRGKGWGHSTLHSSVSDPRTAYAVTMSNHSSTGQFWLR